MNHMTNILLFLFFIKSTSSEEESWTGKWFPNDPAKTEQITESSENKTDLWTGKWFPTNPLNLNLSGLNINDTSSKHPKKELNIQNNHDSYEHDRIMGIPNRECDDGEENLHIDFDGSDSSNACVEEFLKPNYTVEPIHTIHDVPKFYLPMHKCMNETITYKHRIPTIGSHRPLWPVYGEYFPFIPKQRWLHSLEHGAIVMLYHPCTDVTDVEKVKNIVRNCLYRHIITPYRDMSLERPIGIVAYANLIELSYFDEQIISNFIRKFAKAGPEKVSKQGQFNKMLKKKAELVSDIDDSQICPNITEM